METGTAAAAGTRGRAFETRAFVALMAALTGLVLPVSGYINHRLGHAPLTVERHAWMAVHNLMGIAFTVFAVWHIVLNRHGLLRHLRGRRARRLISREGACALGLVAGMLALAAGHALH